MLILLPIVGASQLFHVSCGFDMILQNELNCDESNSQHAEPNSRWFGRPKVFATICAFMLSALLAGCSDPNRSKVIGIWELESAASITSRFKETGNESSNNNDNRMSVEFRSDGVLKTQTLMGSMDRQKEGSWTLLSFDESSSTMRLKCVLGMQETEHEIELLDEDTIRMIPPNMAGVEMKLRFKRVGN